jgi:hypothetical protein
VSTAEAEGFRTVFLILPLLSCLGRDIERLDCPDVTAQPRKLQLARLQLSLPSSDSQHPTCSPLEGVYHRLESGHPGGDSKSSRAKPFRLAGSEVSGCRCKAGCFSSLS